MTINSASLNKESKNGLYLIPTPIGNLGDITYRAVEILKKSDLILCEDTRISGKLLNKFGIKSKLISNHKFNEKRNLSQVINYLKSEKIISLISDAGTPSISDPGALLVRECIKENINIIPLPGASAVNTSVSASGFSDKYFFYGFFPTKEKDLKKDLEILSKLNSSIIFFVSPKKINKAIPVIKKNFPQRKILICREMTKFYEEYIRCNVEDLMLFDKEVKGEITIVISEKKINKKNSHILNESDKRNINKMIKKFSIKEITNFIGQNNLVSKKEIYNYCLKIKNEK
ncbi:16S rRNA (cytidine(1402)-2'-O)-methyltransferase [Pelagibacterales bacterium SAG-MED13]|nr:16S rRNA (cytidine(1402)-2'-O)-methyltransferase [Pelagibacterales bacterium SAG-MED13]